MYADYDIRISEGYPHGAFCECGRVIHLKESEASGVDNIITCPVCGFKMHLYRPSLGRAKNND